MPQSVILADEFAPPEEAAKSTDAPDLASEFAAPSQERPDFIPKQTDYAARESAARERGVAKTSMDQPMIELPQLPELKGTPEEPLSALEKVGSVGAGVYNEGAKLLSSFTSPANVAIALSTGGLAAEAKAGSAIARRALVGIGAYFGATMGKDAYGQAGDAKKTFDDPNASPQEKAAAITAPVLTAGFGILAALGAVHEARPDLAKVIGDKSPKEAATILGEEAAKATNPEEKAVLEQAASKLSEAEKPKLAEEFTPPETNPGQNNETLSTTPEEKPAPPGPEATKLAATPEGQQKLADIQEALKSPDTTIQYSVWDRDLVAPGEDRVLQVDLINDKAAATEHGGIASTSRALLNELGVDAPPAPESMPPGRYTLDEIKAAIAKENPPAETPAETSPDTHGIAARVNEARAKAGDIAPIEPGEGISAEDSVARGRELVKQGADPQAAIDDFAKTGQISSDGMALVRARGAELAKIASDAEGKFGAESPEYKSAAEADSNWAKAVKPMQTEWHKIGQAQQGETAIDTGTFHGLRRAFREATGEDFTPEQATQAKEISSKVAKATAEESAAKQKVFDEIAKQVTEAKTPRRPALSKFISEQAAAARERIKARMAEGRVQSGLDPADLADHAIVGAEYIANGVEAFADWSKEMVKEFGERIVPHLKEIFEEAKKVGEKGIEREERGSTADILKRVKGYIEAGETDFDDIRHKIATETGLPVEEVTIKITETKRMREITDDMYAKMAAYRNIKNEAKQWVASQNTNPYVKALSVPFSAGFKLATFGHGTVAPFTHAPLHFFDPLTARTFWRNYFRGFKLMGVADRGAYHARMMADLVRDPNYIKARRAGLENDPHRIASDYEKAWAGGFFHRIGIMGNRGFDSLKLIRQELFNQQWDGLSKAEQTPQRAKLIADDVNHSTGTVKKKFGPVASSVFFAPRLVASQFAYLVGDSAKAADVLIRKARSADPVERAAALSHVKQVARIAGGLFSLLAINQGLLSATGSKQKVNFTDPSRSDFLRFKMFGQTRGIASSAIGSVALLANLLHDEFMPKEGADKRKSRGEMIADRILKYGRTKLSPTASVATDVITGSDYSKRPLPFSKEKIPAYLRKEGEKAYTVNEYLQTHVTPIPWSEAAREVFKKQGMDESTIVHWLKALASGVEAGVVGDRVSPDYYEGRK